ncbi:MAG: hypothetical protein EPN72_10150 [Nevskiaceae bacterium]|nr:MAG: hypothetical protein EPN63_09490 [Nevskiaceae bacterium]TBR72783.1 MAG: hypothetical protein EPN72_10150 [Nevskiaceae bacterium]
MDHAGAYLAVCDRAGLGELSQLLDGVLNPGGQLKAFPRSALLVIGHGFREFRRRERMEPIRQHYGL